MICDIFIPAILPILRHLNPQIELLTRILLRSIELRGVTGKFFQIFFPGEKCFFPVENFHFGRPKTNFTGVLKSEKQKKRKEKKKKKPTTKKQKQKTKNKTKTKTKTKKKTQIKKRYSPHFVTFPPSIFYFPPSTFPFFLQFCFFFFSQFSPFFIFSLPLFFPVGQQKCPRQKSLGALWPPATSRLLRHWLSSLKRSTRIWY